MTDQSAERETHAVEEGAPPTTDPVVAAEEPLKAPTEIDQPDILPLLTAAYYCYATARAEGSRPLAFGWNSRDGFQVVQENTMRTRTLHKFPLTEDGWDDAWSTLVTEYPELAKAVAVKADVNDHGHRVAAEQKAAKKELLGLQPVAEVTSCVLLGGHGFDPSFQPGTRCSLYFTVEGLWVRTSWSWLPKIRVPYAEARALEFSGPGEVRKGGRFFGGGFGLVGAAEGMIVASVLNALTSRSEIQTIIRFQATDLEAFFFHSKATPENLRILLSDPVMRVNQELDPTPAADQGPIADLERLARLHDQGALSDEEFAVLKAKLIAKISGDSSR